jgi:hypothetical protein
MRSPAEWLLLIPARCCSCLAKTLEDEMVTTFSLREHIPLVLKEGRSSASSFRQCFWAGIQLFGPFVGFKNTGFRPKTCRNDVCSVRTHNEQNK